MDQTNSFALFEQGRDAWNVWAQKMLDARAALEAEGRWTVNGSDFKALTGEAVVWGEGAAADFDGFTFDEDVDFSGFKFPGDARFDEATFKCNAVFDEATFERNAGFEKATFSGYAGFEKATFSGYAGFGEATFKRNARFYEATFSGNAWFVEATFKGDARFVEATFKGDAGFGEATFSGDARFGEATFKRNARFEKATFKGDAGFGEATFKDNARFRQSVFKGNTDFAVARFERDADFHAIDGESAFSLAGVTFHAAPDFIQAHFKEAPRLDNTHIEPQRLWPVGMANIKAWFKGDKDLAARWRALKRLAVEGHDHGQELSFFKGEVKVRRWGEDKPWHALFWFGLFYQLFSDFGRSLLRPALWWAGCVAGFAHTYIWYGVDRLTPISCAVGPGEPWPAALGISIRKGLLFLGQDSTTLNRFYSCLYGHYPDPHIAVAQGETVKRFVAAIPNEVVFLGIAQNLASVALIFLFLLAIRNHFRIK